MKIILISISLLLCACNTAHPEPAPTPAPVKVTEGPMTTVQTTPVTTAFRPGITMDAEHADEFACMIPGNNRTQIDHCKNGVRCKYGIFNCKRTADGGIL